MAASHEWTHNRRHTRSLSQSNLDTNECHKIFGNLSMRSSMAGIHVAAVLQECYVCDSNTFWGTRSASVEHCLIKMKFCQRSDSPFQQVWIAWVICLFRNHHCWAQELQATTRAFLTETHCTMERWEAEREAPIAKEKPRRALYGKTRPYYEQEPI
jgi:hypothetical protein